MEQQDLLQDLEQEIYLERASQGARFTNLLIDFVGLLLISFAVGAVEAAMIIANHGVDAFDSYQSRPSFFSNYLEGAIITILYYFVLEGATKGRTLGKLITGTRAVRKDGAAITWKDAFIRSLCRIVPFEVFSGFGVPWHDTWSETQVIKIRKYNL